MGNILINILPLFGVFLAFFTRSAVVFVVAAIVIPLLLCWWHQKTAVLHVVNFGK